MLANVSVGQSLSVFIFPKTKSWSELVAATLAQWHCQLPGLGEAPTERDSRPSSKLELFTVFSWIWPCTLSQDGPPLSWPSLCHAQRETPCVLQSPVCSRDNILQDASRCQHVTSVRPGNNKCLNSVWWSTTLYIKTGSIIITSHFAAFCGCFVSLTMRMKCILCALLCTSITSHLKFKFYSDNFGKARLETIISPGWLLVLKTGTMSGLYPQWQWALRVIPCYEIIIPGS